MDRARLALAGLLTAAALAALACSPEDGRERGQRGADIGNRPGDAENVELHGKIDPAHGVPTVGQAIKKRQ